MKVLSIVGARPQFIKAAPVSTALRATGLHEVLVHTGQHYDREMSQLFFDEMGIPAPDHNLGIGSGSHGRQTGEMLMALERVMEDERPDWVLVFGDTNSTLAGALAAVKLGFKVAHVEAGLRSFNRTMPEEHNRVLTDHCSDLLFCPCQAAVDQLRREGVVDGVHMVGDVMYDAVLRFSALAEERSDVLDRLGLEPGTYVVATFHRPYNVDNPDRLRAILDGLAASQLPVVFSVHPRTRERIAALDGAGVWASGRVRLLEPMGYLDMLKLERHARVIATDSGGMQKEAMFLSVPCVTVRPETEWTETVASGWNVLAEAEPGIIAPLVAGASPPARSPGTWYGDGTAAAEVARCLAARHFGDIGGRLRMQV